MLDFVFIQLNKKFDKVELRINSSGGCVSDVSKSEKSMEEVFWCDGFVIRDIVFQVACK